MFFDASKPAANMRAVYGGCRETTIRQAYREIVDCATVKSSNVLAPVRLVFNQYRLHHHFCQIQKSQSRLSRYLFT